MNSQRIDVTILMPCLDEAQTLPTCIEAAQAALAALARDGLTGEILISDNGSTDGSQALARRLGCRVVDCPEPGYGNALLWGCRAAAGRYIVMGDSDASYDFREAVPLVRKLGEGYDLCMGSRFAGTILPGAMPWQNRYIGNPVLTGILNVFFRSNLSDAHCGLRAFTKEAFDRMRLCAGGMEFASEMVVKATLVGLRRTEVPITLHPDGRDRPPHLRRWRDGWRHLKFLLMFSPLWLYFVPAAVLMLLSAAVFVALLATPRGAVFRLGPLWLGDHWMILAGGLFVIGFQGALFGMASLRYALTQGYRRETPRLRRLFQLLEIENMLPCGILLALAGLGVLGYVFIVWSEASFGRLSRIREMVVATTLIAVGLQACFGAFLLSIIAERHPQRAPGGAPAPDDAAPAPALHEAP